MCVILVVNHLYAQRVWRCETSFRCGRRMKTPSLNNPFVPATAQSLDTSLRFVVSDRHKLSTIRVFNSRGRSEKKLRRGGAGIGEVDCGVRILVMMN